MTTGIAEALSRAIGQEMTDLAGYAQTRLILPAYPERQMSTGLATLDYDGATTCTLSGGAFPVLTGYEAYQIRVLSGSAAGRTVQILSRDDDTTLTLNVPFLATAAFSGLDWEVVGTAVTVLDVENALDFPEEGRCVLDGVVYSYQTREPQQLQGISYDDGTGRIVQGVAKQHSEGSVLSDYSRVQSVIDQYRRSFEIDHATGSDLSVIGANLGIPRPAELSNDTVYRGFLKALAYAPRGTIRAMEDVLQALLGEQQIAYGTLDASTDPEELATITRLVGDFPVDVVGAFFRVTSGYLTGESILIIAQPETNELTLFRAFSEAFENESWEIVRPNWELFEDQTLRYTPVLPQIPDPIANEWLIQDSTIPGVLNHPSTVYVRRETDPEDPNGRTYLEGEYRIPLNGDLGLDLTRPNLLVAGMRLADESGLVTVATGAGLSSEDGVVVTGPVDAFAAAVLPGDILELTSGPHTGERAVVQSKDSNEILTLGDMFEVENHSDQAAGVFGSAFLNCNWQITRPHTRCALYYPSADVRPEYEGDSGTQAWAFQGTSEVGAQFDLIVDPVIGQALELFANEDFAIYQRQFRTDSESTSMVEVCLVLPEGLNGDTDSGKQFAVLISDGTKTIAWGVRDDETEQPVLGFLDVMTGEFIGNPVPWSGLVGSQDSADLNTVRLEKNGTGPARLYRHAVSIYGETPWELVAEEPYASFPDTVDWTAVCAYDALDREIVWGTLEDGHSTYVQIKWVDWRSENPRDYLSPTSTATATENVLLDVDPPYPINDDLLGREVWIKSAEDLNEAGGSAVGRWIIDSLDEDLLVLVGPTQYRGHTSLVDRQSIFVRGSKPFRWPDHLGHELEWLEGPNTGTYTIEAIIDPATGLEFGNPPLVATPSGVGAIQIHSTDPTDQTAPGPQVRLMGTVGGNVVIETISLVAGAHTPSTTNWDADSVRSMDLVRTTGSPFFSGRLTVSVTSTGEPIGSIPSGDTVWGTPSLVDLRSVSLDSPICRLSSELTISDDEYPWRLLPVFGGPYSTTYELSSPLQGPDVVTVQPLQEVPFLPGTVMGLLTTTVRSAVLATEREPNVWQDGDPPTYLWAPFYLYDGFGFVRRAADLVRAAGIRIDFDHLIRDASGLHILEEL